MPTERFGLTIKAENFPECETEICLTPLSR